MAEFLTHFGKQQLYDAVDQRRVEGGAGAEEGRHLHRHPPRLGGHEHAPDTERRRPTGMARRGSPPTKRHLIGSGRPRSRSCLAAVSSSSSPYRLQLISGGVELLWPFPDNRQTERKRESIMAVATQTFKGNLKKALAGLRRINLEGLRWRVFDAKGQVLGRLASQIATVIQGKDKPTYTPYQEDGDMCIVLNAKDVSVTGRKMTNKFYRWHTGYIGHLKERSLKDQLVKDPTEVIRKAVLRMLPRNKLRDDRDRKLRIFVGSEHPFVDRPLESYVMPPRKMREMRPRARRALIRAQKKAEQGSTGPNHEEKN
ncbi:hypothetical protein OPV22_022094 [Ensete ventricosum]|uniref:50S ribosomal protein L13 n=1 Tax=Ensete ventricosum TaxID=4639 RepID=A0AAV8QQ16_ENSVE|nr:hypothetical protein OPV22_022094 [Ensete ventricosum]